MSQGTRARLISPSFSTQKSTCTLRFWYHMYGGAIGTLNVYIRIFGNDTLYWSKTGNQGNQWLSSGTLKFGAIPSFNVSIYVIGICYYYFTGVFLFLSMPALSYYASLAYLDKTDDVVQINLFPLSSSYCFLPPFAQLVFEGVSGTSFTGDIAIDDIQFGSCACAKGSYMHMHQCASCMVQLICCDNYTPFGYCNHPA